MLAIGSAFALLFSPIYLWMYSLAFVTQTRARQHTVDGEAIELARARTDYSRTHAHTIDAENGVVMVKLRYFSFSLQLQTFSLDFAWWVDDSLYSNGIRSTSSCELTDFSALFFHFRSRSHSFLFSVDLPLVSVFVRGRWCMCVCEGERDGAINEQEECCSRMALTIGRQPQSVRTYRLQTNCKLEPNAVARREIDWGARWNCCMNFYCVGVMNLILERLYVSASRIWQLLKCCTPFSVRCTRV